MWFSLSDKIPSKKAKEKQGLHLIHINTTNKSQEKKSFFLAPHVARLNEWNEPHTKMVIHAFSFLFFIPPILFILSLFFKTHRFDLLREENAWFSPRDQHKRDKLEVLHKKVLSETKGKIRMCVLFFFFFLWSEIVCTRAREEKREARLARTNANRGLRPERSGQFLLSGIGARASARQVDTV